MSEGLSDDDFVPDTPSFAIFLLVKCGTPDQHVRACSVAGDYRLPADTIDTTGGIYTGLPFPNGLDQLSQAINGSFAGVDFSMSGVDATVLQLATVSRDLVNGSKVHLGIVDLGENFAPTGPCDWLFQAIAGKPIIRRTGQGDQAVRTVTLPTTTAFKDRHQAPIAYWTSQGQRSRSADDGFCDLTSAYSAQSTVKWPG